MAAYRPETVFGEAKERHGLRRAKSRGVEHVREQCLLTAMAQNIKRMVKTRARTRPPKTLELAKVDAMGSRIVGARRARFALPNPFLYRLAA